MLPPHRPLAQAGRVGSLYDCTTKQDLLTQSKQISRVITSAVQSLRNYPVVLEATLLHLRDYRSAGHWG